MKKNRVFSILSILLCLILLTGVLTSCDSLNELFSKEEEKTTPITVTPRDARSLTPEEHRLQSFLDRIPLDGCPVCGGTARFMLPVDMGDANDSRPIVHAVDHFWSGGSSPDRSDDLASHQWMVGSNDLASLFESGKTVNKVVVTLLMTTFYTYQYNDYDGTPILNPSGEGLAAYKIAPGSDVCPHMGIQTIMPRAGTVSYFYTDPANNAVVQDDSGFNRYNLFYTNDQIVQSVDERGMVDYTGYNGNTTGLPTSIPQLQKSSVDPNSWSNHTVELDATTARQFYMLPGHEYSVEVYYEAPPPEVKYSLTYDGNGSTAGTVPEGGSYLADIEVDVASQGSLERTGYRFDGWNTKSDGSGDAYKPSSKIKMPKDVTLYAVWLPTATVTFEVNGGTWNAVNIAESSTVTVGTLIAEPAPDPSKSGNAFGGWFKDTEYNYLFNFSEDKVTGNLKLYAKWTPSKLYTVIFDSMGGTELEPYHNVGSGTTIKQPEDPKWTGRDFSGWYLDRDYKTPWNFDDSLVTEDTTLYAKWSTDEYTVTFDSMGGGTINPIKANYGDLVTEPKPPEKEGFTFGGWYTDKDTLKDKWDFASKKIDSDVTLYAKWGNETHTVRFFISSDAPSSSVPPVTDVAFNATIAEPKAPERTGFDFTGWYEDPGLTTPWDFSKDTVTEDITLYAGWRTERFTVTFNSGEGSSVPPETSVKGLTVDRPSDPIREGYQFDGWYKDTTFRKPWDFKRDTVTGDITLYAKWSSVTPEKPDVPSIHIGGQDIPLFGSSKTSTFGIANLIFASLSVILALAIIVLRILQFRNTDPPKDGTYRMWNLLAILLAVPMVSLFLLLQKTSSETALFNGLSILFGLLLLIQILAMVIANKRRRDV